MARRQLKLNRTYFTKRVVPPAFKPPSKVYTLKLHGDLNGAGRATATSTVRKVMLQDLATDIVNQSRAAHINVTMGNQPEVNSTVKGLKQYRAGGSFQDKVAVLVDGSPQRPVKNVSFAGSIIIVSAADKSLIAEAAKYAWGWMIRYSSAYPVRSWPPGKKNNSYSYQSNFEMFVSGRSLVTDPSQLKGGDSLEDDDWIDITNYAPYASKLERQRYARGTFWMAFKKVRAKYGNRLAVRFDYVEAAGSRESGPGGTVRGSTGPIPNAMPVLRIGQPGAFPSRAPKMRKIIRDAKNRSFR